MKRYIKAASSLQDFVIEGTVLKKYVGPGGDVVIPDGITEIGIWAFRDCTGLRSVIIPNGVKSISDFAFDHCADLMSVIIPESVTYIGDSAFDGCSELTSISIPNNVQYLGQYAFEFCAFTSVIIPGSVAEIRSHTFCGCANLESVIIPSSVTTIGPYAFYNCENLTNVTVPNSVTSIGREAFGNTPVDGNLKEFDLDMYDDDWASLVEQLMADVEQVGDPIYEGTDAGEYIAGLCQEVEDSLGVWLESSIQGGQGGIWIYSSEDDSTLAAGIDYEGFNEATIELARDSKNENAFKQAYQRYLEDCIEDYVSEDEE